MFFSSKKYSLSCSPPGSYWPGRQVELLVVNHCHLSACFHSSFSSTISSKLLYQNTTKLNFNMTRENWRCRQSPALLLQSCECHISAVVGFLHQQNSKMQRARQVAARARNATLNAVQWTGQKCKNARLKTNLLFGQPFMPVQLFVCWAIDCIQMGPNVCKRQRQYKVRPSVQNFVYQAFR